MLGPNNLIILYVDLNSHLDLVKCVWFLIFENGQIREFKNLAKIIRPRLLGYNSCRPTKEK